jgi:hypothetical protein
MSIWRHEDFHLWQCNGTPIVVGHLTLQMNLSVFSGRFTRD